MVYLYLVKGLIYIGFGAFVIKGMETAYVHYFKRPLYVHFYLIKKSLSSKQLKILNQNSDLYKKLESNNKKFFQHGVASFIDNYEFIGKEGLVVTDEMKIVIASIYVMITFGMRNYLIETFDKILLYPGEYYSNINKTYHKGEFNIRYKAVVLSWEDVKRGVEIKGDNLNLAIHEFTHALNIHGLKAGDNGATIFHDTYVEIIKYIQQPKVKEKLNSSTFFREYSKTNRLEFFAVILEHFFESPEAFKKHFPNLYVKVKRMLNFNYAGY
jgi:Mlc titration factor MtfA (ptsG expression regulator)